MSTRLPWSPRLRRLVAGPSPAWPRPIDALVEWWARLPPRLRLAAVVALIVAAAVTTQLRVQAAESRWGDAPVEVLVATEDLPLGATAADGLRRARLPPRSLPAQALAEVDDDAVLTAPLPDGAVLTELHVDDRGPGAGLDPSLRVVPVPVQEGWGVEAGGWVDVWVEGGPTLDEPVATSRPVLEVRDADRRPTALVGLHADEVGPVTRAGRDGVWVTHAPPPDAVGGTGR